MSASASPRRFDLLGRGIARRLKFSAAIRWLNSTVLVVAVILAALIVVGRFQGWKLPELPIVLAVTGVWLLAVIGLSLLRKIGSFQALATWDRAAKGRSVLASAQFFEAKTPLTTGEELHLLRAETEAERRRPNLGRDLPYPRPGWSWLLLPLAIGLAFTPWFHPTIAAEDEVISEGASQAAQEQAETLAEAGERLDGLQSLTDAERERLKELSESLAETTETLGEASDRSTREILEELEARARDAEKLAEQLGADSDAWASDELLDEMASHVETAELAEALRDQNAVASSEEAAVLAERLEAEDLTNDAKERFDATFEETNSAATESDQQKPVGRSVDSAAEQLAEDQPAEAGATMRELAAHFEDVARREQAQEELQQLADQLRDSGNEIAQSALDQMSETGGAEESPQGENQPGSDSLAQSGLGETGELPDLPAPGLNNQPPGGNQPPPQGTMAPVPGEGEPPPPGEAQQMTMPGEGRGQPQQGLMAPVPGEAPGEGQGASPQMLGMARGPKVSAPGLEAGNGTAELAPNATEAMAVARDGVVDALRNEDGESTVRAVEGGVRQEAAQRTARGQAADFVAVEEEALDEQSLPVSRRTQVQRYFTALRERFEESD